MLCCGRRCGCITGPLRNYQAAFSAGQWMPELKLTNNMNREAILQARPQGGPSSCFSFSDKWSDTGMTQAAWHTAATCDSSSMSGLPYCIRR